MSTAEWIVLSGILFYLFTCWALFDILSKDFGGIEKKAAWAFVCLVPFIGVVLYLAIGFRKGRRQAKQ